MGRGWLDELAELYMKRKEAVGGILGEEGLVKDGKSLQGQSQRTTWWLSTAAVHNDFNV